MDTTAYQAAARIGRLPSGVQAEMTAQIVAMAQPELAGELRYWAEQCGVAASTFHRETLAAGLAARRPALEEQFGKIEASPKRKRKLAEWVKRVDRRSRRVAVGSPEHALAALEAGE